MGTATFDTDVLKTVDITKTVNLTVEKTVESTVDLDGSLATAEASADAFLFDNSLAETDAFTQVSASGAFAFAESLAAGSEEPDDGTLATTGDLNDGRLDAFVVSTTGTLFPAAVLQSTTGPVDQPLEFDVTTPVANFSIGITGVVAAGDLNGDGFADVAAAYDQRSSEQDVVVFVLNNGQGNLGEDADGNPLPGLSTVLLLPFNADPLAIELGDLNDDGALDAAVAFSGTDGVGIFLNDGNGGFSLNHTVAVGSVPTDVAIGNLDGDPVNEIVVANFNDDNVSVLDFDGTIFRSANDFTVGDGPVAIDIGFLDGGSDLDLLVANSGDGAGQSSVAGLLGSGLGSFGAPVPINVGGRPTDVAFADILGNGGPLDAVVAVVRAGETDVLTALLNLSADGTLQIGQSVRVGLEPSAVAVGDMDSDMFDEIIVGNGGETGFFNVLVIDNDMGNLAVVDAFSVSGAPLDLDLA